MASDYGYRLTQKAADDLDGIINYIALELANPTAAMHFVDKLQDCIKEICLFPESGSAVMNEFLPNSDIRKAIVNNYLIYYLPDSEENVITVLRIVYGRQNMDEILSELDI